jgi:SAM-dependent methyltransferase
VKDSLNAILAGRESTSATAANPIVDGCDVWDEEHGDAQYLPGLEDKTHDFVYPSHTLEHMQDPAVALQNWWRVVKPGGFLILYIPDRDLYEKKSTLPFTVERRPYDILSSRQGRETRHHWHSATPQPYA